MDFLGIGPLELFFILIIALIIFGPNDIVRAGKTIGSFLRKVVTSDGWRTFQQASKGMRDLPNTLPDQFALAQAIGLDAAHLLGAVELETELKQLLEIRLLRRAYSRQFDLIEDEVRWRSPQCLVCPLAI